MKNLGRKSKLAVCSFLAATQVLVPMRGMADGAQCAPPASIAKDTSYGPGSLDDVLKTSSTSNMPLGNAILTMDNDDAFLKKLNIVKSAKYSIDVVYYIFNNDYSSSLYASELIKAAQRNVKVRVLVDLITNYKRLDLFSMMEREGHGNLEVRFFGRPPKEFMKSVAYMTTPCTATDKSACKDEKIAKVEQAFQADSGKNFSTYNNGASGLFLSGFYGKNPKLIASAVLESQKIDLAAMSSSTSGGMSAADKKGIMELGKIYFTSKTGSPIEKLTANIQLAVAEALMGEKVSPLLNAFNEYLPPMNGKAYAQARKEWDHITDFTHHKLTTADGTMAIVGGRNIEDSYHMKPNPLVTKYIFMDTDLYIEPKQCGGQISEAFTKLWNFSEMVATLSDIKKVAPIEILLNLSTYKKAQDACKGRSDAEKCTETTFSQNAISESVRMDLAKDNMEKKASDYTTKYVAKPIDPHFPVLPFVKSDLDNSLVTFMENLPFSRSNPTVRLIDPDAGQDFEHGKYIHHQWRSSIIKACQEGAPEITFHNAYFLAPASFNATLFDMVSGKIPCSNSNLKIVTNSFETTDLNGINLVQRYVMLAFFDALKTNNTGKGVKSFKYFEYLPMQSGPGQHVSLHTKAALIGNDLIIGSANADVRSLMMDTNDALFVRGADNFAQTYNSYLNALVADTTRTREITDSLKSATLDQLIDEDFGATGKVLLLAKKYKADKKMSDQQFKDLINKMKANVGEIYTLTKESIAPLTFGANVPASHKAYINKRGGNLVDRQKAYEKMNTLLELLKVL